MPFKPITANWLSPAFDHLIFPYPELMVAYKVPDYPGAMEGEGNWIDMYLDEKGEHPVGRLWVNPENDGCGVQALPASHLDYVTRDALRLRVFHALDVWVLEAFDRIKAQYYAGETQTGDLAEAYVPVPENDQ